jgi:hypothetical protein
MGYKPAYLSQVVTERSPVGDALIDGMCRAFGFTFLPAPEISKNETSSTVTTPHEEELAKMLERVLDQNDALVKRLDTQGALLTALWEVSIYVLQVFGSTSRTPPAGSTKVNAILR